MTNMLNENTEVQHQTHLPQQHRQNFEPTQLNHDQQQHYSHGQPLPHHVQVQSHSQSYPAQPLLHSQAHQQPQQAYHQSQRQQGQTGPDLSSPICAPPLHRHSQQQHVSLPEAVFAHSSPTLPASNSSPYGQNPSGGGGPSRLASGANSQQAQQIQIVLQNMLMKQQQKQQHDQHHHPLESSNASDGNQSHDLTQSNSKRLRFKSIDNETERRKPELRRDDLDDQSQDTSVSDLMMQQTARQDLSLDPLAIQGEEEEAK